MSTKWSRCWLVTAIACATALAASGRASSEEPPTSEEKQEVANAVPPPARRSPRPGDVTKVFVLRHVGKRGLAEILQVFPATITFATLGPVPNDAIGVSAAPGVMAAIEETIKRLDVPPAPQKDIELTGYVLEALSQPLESARVPSELEGVVAQLKRTFSYAEYRLLDTLILRGSEKARLQADAVGADEQGRSIQYGLRVASAQVLTAEEGPTVRLTRLNFEARIPIPVRPRQADGSNESFQYRTVGVHADVEIRAGQRVVVGKSGVADPSKAIILVLSAKVVD
jgi:hypothetical protein